MRALQAQSPRWGLIEMDGLKAGLVQILEVRFLGGLFHAIILDRGPLWFEGFGKPEHWREFLKTFRVQFPRRPGRFLRFIAEGDDSVEPLLLEAGFRKRTGASYQTFWLDLMQNQELLRKNLHKKWRNLFLRSIKLGVSVVWDEDGSSFPWLLKHYEIDRMRRRYPGPGVKLLRFLVKNYAEKKSVLVGRASYEGADIAGIMILIHGTSATYQIGYTSPEGRTRKAHNLLLWEALGKLQSRGIKDFDLGGINEETPGLTTFKEGMGGEKISLAGVFY